MEGEVIQLSVKQVGSSQIYYLLQNYVMETEHGYLVKLNFSALTYWLGRWIRKGSLPSFCTTAAVRLLLHTRGVFEFWLGTRRRSSCQRYSTNLDQFIAMNQLKTRLANE